MKVTNEFGQRLASLSEAYAQAKVVEPAGLPVIYEPVLQGKDGSWRKPDFFWPCKDGHHGIAWEITPMMMDDRSYRERWLTERLGWYERESDRYLLILSPSLEWDDLCVVRKWACRLLSPGDQVLHEALRLGMPAQICQYYREWLSGL